MNNKSKILFLIGFICAIAAYWFWPFLWDRSFYQLIAVSFAGYTGAIYFLSSGKWSLSVFVVWMVCINSVLDEFFFDPTEMDWNEWTAFLLIILITWNQRKKWTR